MSGSQIMVVLIVLIAVIGGIVRNRHYYAHKRVKAEGDPDAARLRDEVRQLKKRVQVLERVVTDNHGGIGLDREIERLRDR